MDRMCDRIKYYRLRRNQSQNQIAEKMGITASNYQKYEHGQRVPTEKTLPILAAALGCDVFSLRESDKERFIRTYNANLREMAMRQWDMYAFYAQDFEAYDIGEDVIAYFQSWFNEIEEADPELYNKFLYTKDYPKLLIDLAERIYEIDHGELAEHPEWNDFNGIACEERPPLFWYFIVFGHFFLEQYVGETNPVVIASDYKRYLNESVEAGEEYTDGEAFEEYIRRVFIPFFDYILTAVEYMVDEHTNLEQAIQSTLIGEQGEIEIFEFEHDS